MSRHGHTPNPPTNEQIRWLDAIEDNGLNLTVREEEFIGNIGRRLRSGRPLTDAQIEWLEDIYTNRVP